MWKKRENWLFIFAAVGAIAALVKILEYFGITPGTPPPATTAGGPPLPVPVGVPPHSYAGLLWGGLLFAFSIALSAYGFYLANKRKGPHLEIVSVWNNDHVAHEQVIYGTATLSVPPNTVELRVFAGGYWHSQGKADTFGGKWQRTCYFGHPENPAGSKYKLVAIAPKTPLPPKIAELPADALRSEIISVIRSTPSIIDLSTAPRLDIMQERDVKGVELLRFSADKDLTIDSIGPLMSTKRQTVAVEGALGFLRGGTFERRRLLAHDVVTGNVTSLQSLVRPENHTSDSVTVYYSGGGQRLLRTFGVSQFGDSIDWKPDGPPKLHDPAQG
jgi:hypothetical protein